MLNELRDEVHQNAIDHGFYDNVDVNIPEKLMLIVSELGEAMEAYRKYNYANLEYFYSSLEKESPLIDYDENDLFSDLIKDRFEDELADTIIRLLDLCGFMDIDIDKHIELKMKYNKNRPYKHGNKC